jgi:dipeptidyl aminopeptidase/acylaminoacyl peptidase
MTRWDGSKTVRLTTTKENEHHPDWSPDGQYLSFLSGRGIEGGMDQLWLMNRVGGEADKITEFKGAVSDSVWSPDSRRLVLVVEDSDPESADGKEKAEKKSRKPIVIDWSGTRSGTTNISGEYARLAFSPSLCVSVPSPNDSIDLPGAKS